MCKQTTANEEWSHWATWQYQLGQNFISYVFYFGWYVIYWRVTGTFNTVFCIIHGKAINITTSNNIGMFINKIRSKSANIEFSLSFNLSFFDSKHTARSHGKSIWETSCMQNTLWWYTSGRIVIYQSFSVVCLTREC